MDSLQIFRGYQSYHTWTSATVLNDQALIVTKKVTSMVTLAELDILSKHLGLSLHVGETEDYGFIKMMTTQSFPTKILGTYQQQTQ